MIFDKLVFFLIYQYLFLLAKSKSSVEFGQTVTIRQSADNESQMLIILLNSLVRGGTSRLFLHFPHTFECLWPLTLSGKCILYIPSKCKNSRYMELLYLRGNQAFFISNLSHLLYVIINITTCVSLEMKAFWKRWTWTRVFEPGMAGLDLHL